MNKSKQLKETLLRLESQAIAKNCAQPTHLKVKESKIFNGNCIYSLYSVHSNKNSESREMLAYESNIFDISDKT